MVSGFVDTTVIVDMLRGHPPAHSWLANQTALGITPVVWLETVEGAQNKVAQRNAVVLLAQFEMVRLIPDDLDWAMRQLLQFKLSHNSGMMDCLIASVNHRLQLPLYTHNMKHLAPLIGSLAQKPY